MNSRYAVFIGMGFELVGIILAGIYVGKLIDDNYGTKGLGLAGLPLLGLIGWIYHIVVLTKEIDENPSSEKGDKKDSE